MDMDGNYKSFILCLDKSNFSFVHIRIILDNINKNPKTMNILAIIDK